MDKNVLKNSWILAGLLLIINIIIGLVFLAAVRFFEIGSPSISGIAGVMGAMIVGQIYAMNFKEVMSKNLKVCVTTIYIFTQIVLSSLYFLVFGFPNQSLFFGILIGISLIYSPLIYWLLGSGGKTYLKAMQKIAAVKK